MDDGRLPYQWHCPKCGAVTMFHAHRSYNRGGDVLLCECGHCAGRWTEYPNDHPVNRRWWRRVTRWLRKLIWI